MAAAAAVWAFFGRALQHARADPLARHFEKSEMRDVPDLDARAVVLQRLLQAPFDRAVVALLIHVDEVNHDESGEVSEPQLSGDFIVSSRPVSHSRSRYSKSRLISVLVRAAPAVRRMTPMPSGTSSS